MSHSLSSYSGMGYLNMTALAFNAFIADRLEFSASAFPVLGSSENLAAEKTVIFRFLASVVDCLGLGDLAIGPFSNLFWRSEFN